VHYTYIKCLFSGYFSPAGRRQCGVAQDKASKTVTTHTPIVNLMVLSSLLHLLFVSLFYTTFFHNKGGGKQQGESIRNERELTSERNEETEGVQHMGVKCGWWHP